MKAVLDFLWTVIRSTIGFSIVFAGFGLIAWFVSGSMDLWWLCLGGGVLFGVLFGVGDAVAHRLQTVLRRGDGDPDDEPGSESGFVIGQLASIVFGPLGLLLGSLSSPHKPGRGRRAAFGTACGGLIGTLFAAAVSQVARPQGAQALTPLETILWFVPVFMGVGLIAGLCSTDW